MKRSYLDGILRRSRSIQSIVRGEVEWCAAHSRKNGADSPSAQDPTCRARIEELLVLSKGKLVHIALDKRVSTVAACDRVVSLEVEVIILRSIIGSHIRAICQRLCPGVRSCQQETILEFAIKPRLQRVVIRNRRFKQECCRCRAPERLAKGFHGAGVR